MVDKKEFPGILDNISPKLLINENNKNEIQSFFLILGLIYNDLKGLIFFQKFIEDNYRKPAEQEVSAHAGEYNGLIAQADKLLIATVGEFFNFIEENRSILNNVDFLLLLKKVDQENRSRWNKLIKFNDESTILSNIARIRSNITFHYDHSMEELRRGFVASFFSDRKNLVQHARAYYSFGDTMENTRIYFSDAAAEEYIHKLLNITDKAQIRSSINDMNHTIQMLLRAYLKNIKK